MNVVSWNRTNLQLLQIFKRVAVLDPTVVTYKLRVGKRRPAGSRSRMCWAYDGFTDELLIISYSLRGMAQYLGISLGTIYNSTNKIPLLTNTSMGKPIYVKVEGYPGVQRAYSYDYPEWINNQTT